MSFIVVGVDGSESADHALDWACGEAALRGAELHLIHSWEVPPYSGPQVGSSWEEELEMEARGLLDAALRRARQRCGDHIVVEGSITSRSAAGAIVDAAKGADLIVVGSRGRGGFASLLLGSVSTQVANHAECPVAIVRKDQP